jgi:type IV pilus biogenesis protein PilP
MRVYDSARCVARLGALTALVAAPAWAQTAPALAPPSETPAPAPLAAAPPQRVFSAGPEIDALANAAFIYDLKATVGEALNRLCKTPIADPACHPPEFGQNTALPARGSRPALPGIDATLPTPTKVAGIGRNLHADLLYADGRSIAVVIGSVLPGGFRVTDITIDDVTVTRGGATTRLLFNGPSVAPPSPGDVLPPTPASSPPAPPPSTDSANNPPAPVVTMKP